ncbi:MAG: hypothetical protein ACUZ8A_07140, partial [Candidatus Bathyanammoxibius sp.]
DIKWNTVGGAVTKVKLEYYHSGAENRWLLIKTGIANAASNTFTWDRGVDKDNKLPVDLAAQDVRFRVTPTVPIQPDGAFTSNPMVLCGKIVFDGTNSPLNSTIWEAGMTDRTISWQAFGPVSMVKISFSSENGGANYITASPPTVSSITAKETGNVGTYTWTIPAAPVAEYDLIPKIDDGGRSRIKVEDMTSPYGDWCQAESPTFKIKGVLEILGPDVSSGLVAGSPNTVSWRRKGKIGNVNVKYSIDAGADNYPYDIALNVPWGDIDTGTDESRTWDIAEAAFLGDDYTLLIEDAKHVRTPGGVDGTFIESAVPFAVKGELLVTYPTGAAVTWAILETKTITWNVVHGNIPNVRLYYSTDETNFTNPVEIDAGSKDADGVIGFPNGLPPPMAKGSYVWEITSAVPVGNVWVRVCDADTDKFPDVYSQTTRINITGSIYIETPGAYTPTGDWNVGDTQRTIQWTAYGDLGTVWIDFHDGSQWIAVTDSNGVASGNETVETFSVSNWDGELAVPDVKYDKCKVRIKDDQVWLTAVAKSTSGEFWTYPTITNVQITPTDPPDKAGIWITQAVNQEVTWAEGGSGIDVKVYYSPDAGNNWSWLRDSTDAGFCNGILVPTARSITALIRVEDDDPVYKNKINNLSGQFNIFSGITIGQPTDSSKWKVGDSSKKIEWTYSGDITKVDIEVDYGSGYAALVSDVLVGAGDPGWDWIDGGTGGIPDQVSNYVMIKIADRSYPADSYTEVGPFKIIPAFDFTAPLGGEVHKITDDTAPAGYDIKWNTVGGAVTKVKLEYYHSGAVNNWLLIKTGIANAASNTFTWDRGVDKDNKLPVDLA